jgi:2'-5' RNA ligase
MPRTFLALDLDPASISALEDLASALRGCTPPNVHARWSAPTQLHVTVKFLGQATEEQTSALGARLSSLAENAPPLLHLAALDAFPTPARASVLMVRLADAGGALLSLHRAADGDASSLGFPREPRPYVPHVTLARLREPRRVTGWFDAAAATASRVLAIGARATALVLYRSDLSEKGSIYSPLARASVRAS